MTMKKKILTTLSIVLILGMAALGILAYLSDTDSDVNVMTLGNVDIEQIEDFKDTGLYPNTTVKKIVTVDNVGKSNAYVRTWFAFEAPVDEIIAEWEGTAPTPLGTGKIDGKDYVIYAIEYGEMTPEQDPITTLKSVSMDKDATNDSIKSFGDTYEVLVFTQAIQTAGFENAAAAWAAEGSFGATVLANHPWKEFTFVDTAAELQAALDAAVDGTEIVLGADITGDVTATQKPGVKITIDGNGNDFAGVLLVDGKSGTYTTAGLTVKNVNFVADSISADACIQLGNGTNATRYTCNVTIEGCTFDVPGAVGVKSYTGGDKNLVIRDCTATADAHSLIQAKGIDGILVENCKVYSKNGLNFNNSDNVIVSGCTVDVKGYAVRFGESSGGVGAAETYLIKNCTLKSANADGDAVIILRGTADYATLTIENTTITGTPDIANTATGATVVK